MRCEVGFVLAFAASGCSALFGLDHPVQEDARVVDTGPDAAPVCVGVGNFFICVPDDVPDRLDVAGAMTLVTDQACAYLDPSNPTWCIYAARHVNIEGKLRATGSRHFVLIATDDLLIRETGVVDVASHAATSPGTGIGAGGGGACSGAGAGAGVNDVNGAGGGAGGTYGTAGGRGGDGNSAGGAPAGVDVQGILGTRLRGGCSGGLGGTGSTAADTGGAGGGGVYLAAAGTITIAGTVNASGAGGGRGNASKGGGSGGGSGGMIAIWAGGSLSVTGEVFANGGGGGGGADNAATGNPGGDSPNADTKAAGGAGGGTTSCGQGPGCGGDGAAKAGNGQNGYNDSTQAGGGGGGGGLGVIRIVSGQAQMTGKFSPSPLTD
jgi:hypothetical protein